MLGSEQESYAQRQPQLGRTERIAALNDKLRKTQTGGKMVVTRGVLGFVGAELPELLQALAAFDKFDEDNDPYGEHDFGQVRYGDHDLLWKIDYYDRALQYASEDPANPDVTTRVLTIMLDSEY